MLLLLVTTLVAVSATVVLHAAGTTWWLARLRARHAGQNGNQWLLSWILVKTALILIALHSAEVFVWALTYRLLPGTGLTSLEESMYFSFVTFTTLGYGDVILDQRWRLLTGIESLSGVLLVGWSTAFIFLIIQHAWKEPE